MVVKLCLMASHGYLSGGVVLPQDHGINRDCQPFWSCHGPKHDIMRIGSLNFKTQGFEEAWNPTSRLSDSARCVKIEPTVKLPSFADNQDARSSSTSMLFSSVISEHCTRREKILQILASVASEKPEGDGLDIALLSELMELQSLRIDLHEQSSPLIYPNTELFTQKPVIDFVGELIGSSRITVHPDGRVLFNDTGTDVRDLLSLVAEFYLPNTSAKGEKHSMLVPQFGWLSSSEAGLLHGSLPQASTVASLKSPKKVKTKLTKKKMSKKGSGVRNLYQKNYFHACETLLSIMTDRRKNRKTAILSIQKSGPELPELLNWFSTTIAGTGLTILCSVVCQLVCSRVSLFCSSKILSTGLGLGLFWLSWAVNKLRYTIVYAGKNTRKLGLKEEEMMSRVDKSVKEINFGAVTMLAVAVLRFA